ncbi:hypothetical protein TNCV_4189421 [Trichonephila clavipes]|nr:hypothetical protein TNCV_4189421 [Trichonephila clavipes]
MYSTRLLWSRYPSGHGHKLIAVVSEFRALVPLKTPMRVKPVEAQSPPVAVVWKLGERGANKGFVLFI